MQKFVLGSLILSLALAGCESVESPGPSAVADAPKATGAAATPLKAPSGLYELDPNHASLRFSVEHVGLSQYYLSFSDYKVSVQLLADKPEASTVSLRIDPLSVTATYSGDYQATHKDSPFKTWEEALARSPKFLNADEHEEITYTSKAVSADGNGRWRIEGELTLLGQTKPVELIAQLTGSYAEHPFTGKGAIGFSARGQFNRSEFGMDHLVKPGIVGDVVTVHFDGELHQVVADPQ